MKKSALKIVIASVTLLSLIDLIFNINHISKNLLFGIIWIVLILSTLYWTWRLLTDFKFESSYFKKVYLVFLFYGLVTIFRGWSFSNESLSSYLRVPYIFWPFLVPILVFFDKSFDTLGFLLRYFYILGWVFLLVILCFPSLLLNRISAETIIFSLAFGSGFLLLNSTYLSSGKVNFAFLVIFLSLISLTFVARRSGLLVLLGFIFFSLIYNIRNKPGKTIFRIFPLLIGFGCIIMVSFNDVYQTLTKRLNERILEDSRSTVINYFLNDMSNSLLFGKGMDGRYFCPIGGGEEDDGMVYQEVEYRDVIENGYLQLMLSGGIMHIILFLLVLIPAAILGVFKSSNQFTKACGTMIIIWLIYMFGFGQPSLNLGYILVWICTGVCYKKSIRSKNDMELVYEFQKYNKSFFKLR